MNKHILKSAIILCLTVPWLLLINFFWRKTSRREYIKNLRFNREAFLPLIQDSAEIAKADMYVFNIWATWCRPCVEEIPDLNNLKSRYSAPNVAFVALTYEDSTRTSLFFKKNPNRFTYWQRNKAFMAIDALEGLNPDSSLKFSEGGTIPVHIITYRDRVVYYNIGADEGNIHRMDSVLKRYTGLVKH